MEKIKKISLDDQVIKMDLENHELSIPLNQDYVKKYINNALLETKTYLKDFKFYKFGSNVCKLACLFSISMFIGCALADFLLLDLMAMLCGGLGGVSLLSFTLFKLLEKKSLIKAYNNEYWTKIKEVAIKNIDKSNDKKKSSTKAQDNKKEQNRTTNFHNNLMEESEITKSGRKL